MPKKYFAKKGNKKSGGGPFNMGSYGHGKNPIMMKSPLKEGTTEQKARAVELSKKHGDKPGFQEYLDKTFGGKTKVKGSTSYTRKKK